MKKIILLMITTSIIFFITACGGQQGNSDDVNQNEPVEGATLLEIHATNFEFDQPEYVVEAGEPVTIELINDEGMHGISIQELGINIDGNGTATITPNEPGEYTIYCSVLCGTGHGNMMSKLIVE